MVYQPREDSELLNQFVKEYAEEKTVLDIGTGSGIQALTAAEVAEEVLAVDISEEAVEHVKEESEKRDLNNLKVLKSNLFEKVNKKFDLIIFNPPYLPESKKKELSDGNKTALCGGEKGHELITKFLRQVKKHLKDNGKILLLFSSLSNKELINQTIKEEGMHFKKLVTEAHFFEKLYVYEIF